MHTTSKYVRETTPDDLVFLAPRLRAADVEEIRAGTGMEPGPALFLGLRTSEKCFTMIDDAQVPLGVFGFVRYKIHGPRTVNSAVAWMLCTDRLKENSLKFLKRCKDFFNEETKGYDLIWNHVDARNKLHIKWLKWMGFTFLNAYPAGPKKLPFYLFSKITP